MWKLLFKPEFKKPKQLVSELRSEAWRPFSTALAIDKELAGWLACFPVLGLFPTFPFNRPLLLSFSEATGRMKGMARLKTAYSNETDCVCACEGGHPIIQYNTKIIYINKDKTWGCLRCAGYLEGQGFLLVQISDAFMKMGVWPKFPIHQLWKIHILELCENIQILELC